MKVKDSQLLTLMYKLNMARFSQDPEAIDEAIDKLDNFLGRPFDLEAEIPPGSIH